VEVTAASVSRADEWGCLLSASVWWLLRCGWHVFLNEQMSPLFALLQRRRRLRKGPAVVTRAASGWWWRRWAGAAARAAGGLAAWGRASRGRAGVWLRRGGPPAMDFWFVLHIVTIAMLPCLHIMFWPTRIDACMQHMAGRVSHPYPDILPYGRLARARQNSATL